MSSCHCLREVDIDLTDADLRHAESAGLRPLLQEGSIREAARVDYIGSSVPTSPSPASYETSRIEFGGDTTLFVVTENDSSGIPANGGLRISAYESEGQALRDAYRLACRMTLKHRLYRTGFLGAKLVVRGNPKTVDRAKLFAVVADVLNRRRGTVYTGCDLNTNAHDMSLLHEMSPYILSAMDSAVDPSRATAEGIYGSLRAAFNEDIEGKTFLVHGIGKTGGLVVRRILENGGVVLACDLDPGRADVAGCRNVSRADAWWRIPVDGLILCSASGTVNQEMATTLRAQAVVSGANCPFVDRATERILKARRILTIPDCVCNAGAVICDSIEHYDNESFRSADPTEIYDFVEQLVHQKAREFIRLDAIEFADNEAIMRELCASTSSRGFCGVEFSRSDRVLRRRSVASM
jgi:leucine dehydrogenase